MVEKFSVNWFSAPTFLSPLWSPLYLSSLIYSFPSRCLCGSRFVWFIETNHSSCPCKHLSYFHSFSLSNPVGPTTASDHKHTCTFTSTEAHSGNKSPAFLCVLFFFLSFKPKHQSLLLLSSMQFIHLLNVQLSETRQQSHNGDKSGG